MNWFPPCMNCGYCCRKAPCHEAYQAFPDLDVSRFGLSDSPGCPALRPNRTGGFECGLVLDATGDRLLRLVESLSIGAGSCASLNTDRQRRLSPEQWAQESAWRRL